VYSNIRSKQAKEEEEERNIVYERVMNRQVFGSWQREMLFSLLCLLLLFYCCCWSKFGGRVKK